MCIWREIHLQSYTHFKEGQPSPKLQECQNYHGAKMAATISVVLLGSCLWLLGLRRLLTPPSPGTGRPVNCVWFKLDRFAPS